jgi:hypothetical protein
MSQRSVATTGARHLARGALVDYIVYTIAVTAVQGDSTARPSFGDRRARSGLTPSTARHSPAGAMFGRDGLPLAADDDGRALTWRRLSRRRPG